MHSQDDLDFRLEDDGTLYIGRGTSDPYGAEQRVALFNWVDGYGTGAIEILKFTDNAGHLVQMNLTNFARLWLGLSYDSPMSDGDNIRPHGSQFVSNPDTDVTIIGEPLAGFELHIPLPIYSEAQTSVDSGRMIGQDWSSSLDHFVVG